MNTKEIPLGATSIGDGSFSIIAGPCSIESQQQFLETAQFVKSAGAVALRGGMFKLRSQADSFQGLGDEAFSIANL